MSQEKGNCCWCTDQCERCKCKTCRKCNPGKQGNCKKTDVAMTTRPESAEAQMNTPKQACCNCRNECEKSCVCRAAKKTCKKCKLRNCTNADAAEVDTKCEGQLKTPCCKCTTDDCESCSCKKELRFCTSCETPNCVNHTLNVSVLLWNIDGDKGINKARNLVVKGVVIEVDPDVILLQEVRSKPLIQEIMKRGYKKEIAGKEEEAQILYKTNKFHHTCTEERKVLETAIDDGGTRMTTRSRKELFIDRTSIVRLTTIGYNLNFVFLSFHNERHGQHSSEHFCQIVSQISQTTQCIVIAGADANDTLPFGESNGYTVLEYDATDRRKEKEIDHFIVANPSNIIIPKPEAFNFVDTKDGQKLHQQMTSLKPKLKSIKYHKVLKKGLGKKKDDAALHDALDSKLEGDLDKMVEALGKSLDKGLQEGLKKVLGKVSDKPQLHEALLNGFRKTLQEALDQALRIDEGMISNHDPILLDLTIDTKERQSRESV